MEKLNDLRALLGHEIEDLYSAESQILEALPLMIGKVKSPELRQALQEHLEITRGQRDRLEQVRTLLSESSTPKKGKGVLGGLFSGKSETKCLAMEGIIKEAQHLMSEDMSPEVMDAAIIGAAQKVEHYEICGYGTARAFAQELNLTEVAELLEETLDEEYEADDRLTDLAVNRLNQQAETGNQSEAVEEEMPELQMVSNTRGSAASKGSATGGRKAPAPSKAAGTRGGTTGSARSGSTGSTRSAASKNSSTPTPRSAAPKKSSGGRTGGSSRGR